MKGSRAVGRLAAVLLCGFFLAAAVSRALAQSHGGPPARQPGGPGGPSGPPPPGTGRSSAEAAPVPADRRSAAAQFGPPGRWWDDKSVIKAVGITPGQQGRMDAIFNANKATIVDAYKNLLSERAKLQTISKAPQVDQAQMFAAIDRVNQAHAALEKATTQMLLDIRQQMQPDQISRLEHLPSTPPK